MDTVSNSTLIGYGIWTILGWCWDQKCAKKISPTPKHQQQPEPLKQGRMERTPNSDPTIWVSQLKLRFIRTDTVCQSVIVQSGIPCVNVSHSFLFSSDTSRTRCGIQLLQPVCFKVEDCVLYILGEMGDLVLSCYHHKPILSNCK